MVDFLMSGPDYFPGWISIAFSAGLALGIVHHLPCLVFGRGAAGSTPATRRWPCP